MCREIYLQQHDIDPDKAALLNAADAAVQAEAKREGRSHAVAVLYRRPGDTAAPSLAA